MRPSRARYKIYIIDEVHMLTKEAFNALLKTLEEPPEHVKFIFATTEPNKIPITILSRCQRYDFAGIDASAIHARLEQIARNEGVEASPEALQIIASRAAGSMRDSQSLLEQLLATGADVISADDVANMLGLASSAVLSELVRPIVERDAASALTALDRAISEGADVGQLIDQLLGYFRDALTQAVGCDVDCMLHALPEQQDEVRQVAARLGVQTLLAVSQILDAAASKLRVSTQARTLAEMAIVRLCCLENLDELAALLEHLKSGGTLPEVDSNTAASQRVASQVGNASRADTTADPAPQDVVGQPVAAAAQARGDVDLSSTEKSAESVADEANLTEATAKQCWEQAVSSLSGLVAGYAAAANKISVDSSGRLVASFPNSQSICKDGCERPANLAKLESAIAAVAGRRIVILFEMHDDPKNGQERASAIKSRRQQMADASSRPIVQKAIELFDADPGNLRYFPPDED